MRAKRSLAYLTLACFSLIPLTRLHAAPYSGESFTYRQPDGEVFQVRLFGDEFFAYQETDDGYLVVRDPKNGFFCYAKVTPDGSKLISTGVRVGRAKPAGLKLKQRLPEGAAMSASLANRNLLEKDAKGRRNVGKKLVEEPGGGIRNVSPDGTSEGSGDSGIIIAPAPPPGPTLNKRVGLVLLASFPDRPGDITKTVADVDNYCNAETYTTGGNATSISGYFHIQSNGKLDYKNNVTAWFTAANPRSYYTDNTISYATRARELIREGLTVLKAQGFDFTKCDGNGDGKLDGVNIFYAGNTVNAWSEGLWPHQSSSSWTGLTGTGLTSTSYDYQITDMPASLPIGTFCHENGHMICDFPDLYSYNGNAANVGGFSLMASSGSTHPRHVDPYLKIHAGWADVVDLTSTSNLQCSVQQDRNFFYRYRNPAKTTEYFLFEVRGNAGYEGPWGGAGATNPANGLVVYHANQTGSNTNSSIFTRANPPTTTLSYTTPYELMVVEAAPITLANGDPWYTDPSPSSNDAFSSTGVSSLSDGTTPDLKFWASNGRTTASGANINTISAAGATMTFKAGSGSLPATPVTNVTTTQLAPKVDYGQNAASQTFAVFNSAGGTLSYSITDNVAWLSCAPASGSVTTSTNTITVTYTTSALAAGTHSATITIDGGSGGIKTIPVTLTVNAQPTLTSFPSSVSISAYTGSSNNKSTFYVGNSGGGTASYSITKTQSWLSLDRTSGTVASEQDLITATLNATSLSPGVYTDTITVTSSAATNSPLTIAVTFTVLSADMIATSPNGGEQWIKAETRAVTWISSLGGNVKIELFKGGVFNATIVANTPNDGAFDWTISGGQAAASDYTVKITSIETPAKTDSSDANFSILPTLADALDTSGLTWTSSGNLPWFAQSATTHDGVDAAQSGAIGDSQTSSMETTLTGPGTLTFWWKVSSEGGYDWLSFFLNNVEQTGDLAKIAGTVDWVQKTVAIPSGSQTIKWTYSKDGSVNTGSDAAWVDEVVFTPASTPEIAVEQPLNTDLTDGVATINFGSVTAGSSGSPFTFTIRNSGTANLTGLALSKTGTHNADYILGALGATSLAPNATTTFTVTFSPGAAGTRTAAIQIASNDSNENPFDINLTGTGLGPGTLAVTAGDLVSTGSYGGSFSPPSKIYTLSNPGSTSINWTAGKTAAWVDLSATSGTLAAGANTTVTASINTNANSLVVGDYSDAVSFTNSTNGSGNTTRGVSLAVTPILASVNLSNLSQTYNGSPRPITVVTTPSGLSHSVTYGGSSTAPTNVGSYDVIATVTQANYSGSSSSIMRINKASQTITFGALSPVLDNAAPFALGATSSSGLAVSYASSNTNVATVSGNTVTIVGLGSTTITASQGGNANYNAAISVPQTLNVERSNPLAVTGGPYKVLVGQTLSLNGSGSFPSYGETISAYSWDLNNDNTFGDATGATPASINYTSLTSTWGMVEGLNAIQLRVTDSVGKTSTISTTVEIVIGLTWDANGATANRTDGAGVWLDANKWWDGSANATWTSGSSANFGNGGTGGAVTLASATSVNTLVFNSFGGTYTLGTSGSGITLGGGIIKNAGSGAATFVSPITLGGAQSWVNNSATALTTASGTNLIDNAGHSLTVDGTGIANFGVVSGSAVTLTGAGDLVKNGSGRLNVGGLNSGFTGAVTINGGVLQGYNDAGVLGNGNVTLNGGVLSFYWGAIYARTLGTGTSQAQILGGESGFAGAGSTGPTINLGTTVVWGGAGEGAATGYFNPGKFVLGDSGTTNAGTTTFSSGIDLNGATRTIVVPAGLNAGLNRSTISAVISNGSGTAGLTKEGGGWLLLATAPTYNGATTVSAGFLDLAALNLNSMGGGAGVRSIAVAAGATVKRNTLDNAFLNRLVETTNEFGVMTGTTANNLDFSSSTGANLPNVFLGNWAGNGAKCEYSGTLTPAADNYRLGAKDSNGFLSIVGTNKLTGARGLLVGQTGGSGIRVMLAGSNDFTGETVINTGARLTLGNNLAIQNSALNVGASGGNFALNSAGTVTGAAVSASPTFGGLVGSRNLLSVFTNAGGNNEANLAATAVTGFTLNPGMAISCNYSGAIADFATGTTLTKTGLGTQILSGANTYTGATTVSAGKLFINGSLSNVAVALDVASGATLGGTGTIGRDVTIADGGKLEFNISTVAGSHDRLDISAGRGFAFSGASVLTITSGSGASPGTYTLVTGGNNISGLAPATVNLPLGWTANVSISGNSLLLEVISISGPGPVDHFVISGVPSQAIIGSQSTGITITAQDAANQTATSFTGTVSFGGTAGITGTSASFVSGVLSGVGITPMVPGGSLTFTVNDGSGHAGSTNLTVLSLFENWSSGTFDNTFSDTASTSNPDGDSLNNLQEFAFGMDPTSSILIPLSYQAGDAVINAGIPVMENAGTSQAPSYRVVFMRRKDYQMAGLNYTVQFTADLDLWTASAEEATTRTGENADIMEAVSVPFPGTVPVTGGGPAQPPKFFRVAVDEE